ncbi:MAG TPA: hypothetical protein VLX31_12055 [Streptosporangiaceae bacterium]|nr:hypothetical protein [Streptosporangiaceae bacterium]
MSSQAPDQLAPMSDVREEGLRLVRAADARGLAVRLIGGVAVWARCPSAELPGLRRDYGDVDIIGLAKESKNLTKFLEEMGYQPDKLFNAIHGAQRLNFADAASGRPLDVLLDRFAMCHAIDLRGRLAADQVTIPLADLLLTKLQVVQVNDKDFADLMALLADHALDGADREHIDVGRLTDVLGRDWGFEHTVRINLGKLGEAVAERGLPGPVAAAIGERVTGLLGALDHGRKSVAWQVRARVGERVRWYELPEDARR